MFSRARRLPSFQSEAAELGILGACSARRRQQHNGETQRDSQTGVCTRV